jgi:hypothetical protein
VLLTVDEGLGSLAAVRALHAAGHEPFVGLWRTDTYAARSRRAAGRVRLPDPQIEPKAHADAILRAARDGGFAVLLPGTEPSMQALADHPIEPPPGVALGLPSADALARATDKRLLRRLASDAGLDALPQTEGDAAALLGVDFDYPVIVKPLRSVEPAGASRLDVVRVRPAHTRAELSAAVAQAPDRTWLVEPLVQGVLEATCGVAWRGEVVCAMHQESPRVWPLGQGISSFARTVSPDAEREIRVRALVAGLGWSGIFGLQFLRVEGRSYAIDFNPRVYGSIALAIAAGHNLPAIWVELLRGRRPVVGSYRVGVFYRVTGNDVRSAVGTWREGDRRNALRALAPRRGTVHGALSVRDPRPLLAGVRRVRRRLSGSAV